MDRLLVLRDGLIEHFGATEEVLPRVTKAVPRAASDSAKAPAAPAAVRQEVVKA
jgi:ABC-type protease/lipase transport system fused ATPase/permease subunit